MTDNRREKRIDRIEVRIGPDAKARFLDACRRAGDMPSAVIREALEDYVTEVEAAERQTLKQEVSMTLIRNPLKALSMGLASAVAAFLLVAAPSSADERLFKALDRDGDGVLQAADVGPLNEKVISILDIDKSGGLTLDEFRTEAEYVDIAFTGFIELEGSEVTISEDRETVTVDEMEFDLNPDANEVSTAGPVYADDGSVRFKVDNPRHTLVTFDLSHEGEIRLSTRSLSEEELDGFQADLIVLSQVEGDTSEMADTP